MASISSLGIGSGLDINGMITQLMAAERVPLNQLQTQATSLQTKLSTYGKLQGALSAVRDAASALANASTWGQTSASSSDASAVAASSSSTTLAGSYTVNVTSLTQAQTNVSKAYASADSIVGEGTLRIERGSWAADNSFTPMDGATAVDITLGPPPASLAQLRDKINSSAAGVTASVVTDSTGARLVIKSNPPGAGNGFRIGATDSDGNNSDGLGLSALAFDPSAGILTMSQALAASNANLTINGVPISSATNQLSNVMDGLSLTLNKVTSTPVTVTTSSDNTAMKKAVSTFVTAYNDLNKLLVDQTKYDPNNKRGDNLQGDSAAISLRAQLRATIGATGGGSATYTRLADVGLDVQTDGSIKLNDSKLTQALGNLGELSKLFANADTLAPEKDGLARRLRATADQMLGIDGSLSSRQQGLRDRIARNQDSQEAMQLRVANVEKRLRAQYTALDKQMGALTATSSYVTTQLKAIFNSSSN